MKARKYPFIAINSRFLYFGRSRQRQR